MPKPTTIEGDQTVKGKLTGENGVEVVGTATLDDIQGQVHVVKDDAELSAALSEATDHDAIWLMANAYSDDYTVSQLGLQIQGIGTSQPRLDGDWTATAPRVTFRDVHFASTLSGTNGEVSLNGDSHGVIGCLFRDGTLSIDGLSTIVAACQVQRDSFSVTLTSNSEECEIRACTDFRSITRNGTRNLVEGRGVNAGDPSSGGDWSNSAPMAVRRNAVIEDTTNNTLYMAVGGSYTQIG